MCCMYVLMYVVFCGKYMYIISTCTKDVSGVLGCDVSLSDADSIIVYSSLFN